MFIVVAVPPDQTTTVECNVTVGEHNLRCFVVFTSPVAHSLRVGSGPCVDGAVLHRASSLQRPVLLALSAFPSRRAQGSLCRIQSRFQAGFCVQLSAGFDNPVSLGPISPLGAAFAYTFLVKLGMHPSASHPETVALMIPACVLAQARLRVPTKCTLRLQTKTARPVRTRTLRACPALY